MINFSLFDFVKINWGTFPYALNKKGRIISEIHFG